MQSAKYEIWTHRPFLQLFVNLIGCVYKVNIPCWYFDWLWEMVRNWPVAGCYFALCEWDLFWEWEKDEVVCEVPVSTWPQCMIEDILSVMPYRHTFNEVLVEEPVSECRDMAASNASLPLLISLSLLPQLCLTIFHWVIDGASIYIHAIVSCVRKNLTMLKWNGDKHEQK